MRNPWNKREAVETEIELTGNRIPIRLLVKNEGFNEILEIMLATNFLETVSPYSINTNGILLTYNDKKIYIERKWQVNVIFIYLFE